MRRFRFFTLGLVLFISACAVDTGPGPVGPPGSWYDGPYYPWYDGGDVIIGGTWGRDRAWHGGWHGGWHGNWHGQSHGVWHGGRRGGWRGGGHSSHPAPNPNGHH